ncbi:MAG TPA: peptidylprolyl isomerase [Candidatus Limnocylindrales bacterium]|nr:peptidylprolyl isomerase [Candidatus Limnocylindrales bacterium]
MADQQAATGATIHTTKGDIEVEVFPGDAPKAANNFLDLARKGFYDGVIFHRVVPGFVIQGGDPTGTGRGGPGYTFEDEPFSGDYERGTLAMANAGPNTNGSQFFICLADLRGRLPKNYTVFGRVTGGMDVVDAIAAGRTGANDRPVEPVTMTSVDVAPGTPQA